MSGENDQSRRAAPQGAAPAKPLPSPRPAAGGNPFLEAAPPTAASRPAAVRRAKPPPGIISAGGVDMARAHASNIRPVADTEHKPADTAKVVLAVETDPRRVRTIPRMDGIRPTAGVPPTGVAVAAGAAAVAGKASPWANNKGPAPEAVDKRALPSANIPSAEPPPVPAAPTTAAPKKEKDKATFYLTIATAVVLMLLLAGVFKQLRRYTARSGDPSPTRTGGTLIPPPLPPEPASAEPSASVAAVAAPQVPHPAAAPSEETPIEISLEPSEEAPVKHSAPIVRVRPPPPPPPPKATFTPLFELPDEKK
jgi:hypothetical protein